MSDSRISWPEIRDASPSWFDELEEFAREPFSYIWTLIIEGILDMWSELLGYLDMVVRQVAIEPTQALTASIVGAIRALVNSVAGVYILLGNEINAIALELGLAAPIALVIAWAIPVILSSIALYVVIGVIATYVPIQPLIDQMDRDIRRGWE